MKEQRPADVEPRLALGRAYEKVGQPADAVREYRDILALHPAHPAATQALARVGGRLDGPLRCLPQDEASAAEAGARTR